jgi:hypothetical protein
MTKATTRPNRPVASHNAKPNIARPNWPSAADGLRSAPAGAEQRETGQTSADVFCGFSFHGSVLLDDLRWLDETERT